MTGERATRGGEAMMKVDPKTIQIAREKNYFVMRLMVDARTRAKDETDCTFEFIAPISSEQRKELLDLILKWRGMMPRKGKR